MYVCNPRNILHSYSCLRPVNYLKHIMLKDISFCALHFKSDITLKPVVCQPFSAVLGALNGYRDCVNKGFPRPSVLDHYNLSNKSKLYTDAGLTNYTLLVGLGVPLKMSRNILWMEDSK